MFPILTTLAPMANILVLVSDPFLCAPCRLFHGFISHLSNHEKILLSSLESSASATLTRDITWQQPAMGRACRQSTSETSAHATLDRDMAWPQAVTAIDSSACMHHIEDQAVANWPNSAKMSSLLELLMYLCVPGVTVKWKCGYYHALTLLLSLNSNFTCCNFCKYN